MRSSFSNEELSQSLELYAIFFFTSPALSSSADFPVIAVNIAKRSASLNFSRVSMLTGRIVSSS